MSSADQQAGCSDPSRFKTDVLTDLRAIHAKMHKGGYYGFEQSIWCRAVQEIERLRAEVKHLRVVKP